MLLLIPIFFSVTSIICIVAKADDSQAPTLKSSLLSPLLPPSLILGSSLPYSCVTDG